MNTTLDPRRREAARLEELNRLGAMRSEADRVLQELVDDAREAFGTKFCMVNLVTADAQYFRAWSGKMPSAVAGVKRNPRDRSMCRHVVEGERPVVVEDFLTTEHFKEQHSRMGPGVRFYAGTPLNTSGGHVIGSFCVLDDQPREFGEKDLVTLRAFARAVVGRLETLGAVAYERAARESERQYRRNVFELANDAILIYSTETGLIQDANRRACEMYGIPQEDLVGKKIAELSLEPKREQEHSQELLHRGSNRGFETMHRRADGTPMHVSINSSVTEYGGGQAILSILRDVTERRQAEEEIRSSEARSNAILDASPDLMFLFNRAGEILGFKAAGKESILYLPPDKVAGGRVQDLMPAAIADEALHFIARALDTGELQFYEYRLSVQGGPRDFEARLVKSGTDEVLCIVRDVTGRKRAEEALRRSEERFRSLIQNAPDLIVVLDADNNILYDSPSIRRVLGYEPGERIGSKGFDYVHPEELKRVEHTFVEILNNPGIESPVEYRLRHKDGSWRHFEAIRTNLLDDPAVGGVVINCRDVTERKRFEEALQQSEAWFRAIFENAALGISIADLDRKLLETNSAYQRMLGYGREQLVGKPIAEISHPEDVPEDEELNRGLLAGNIDRYQREKRYIREDGELAWVRPTVSIVRDAEGDPRFLVGMVEDITERKRMEEALRESEERHRRQAWELDLLHQVRSALAQELEPPAVFRTVVEAIVRTYGYTQVSAYLLQDEALVLQHQVGYERVLARIPVDRGIMGRVARTRQPVLLRDARSDPEFLDAIADITSEVCVPLLDESGVIGTLNVESTGGVELTEDDLRLMTALAEHVKVALSRARLHARVRDSEQRFRSLIQNASDIITLLEPDGTMRYQSPSVERTLGYSPEELIGKNAFDYIHPDDLDRALGAFAETLANPEVRPSVEYRFRRKDGSWSYLESIGSNLLDDPSVNELIVNSRDITERKRLEESHRGVEEKYRSLVETIPAITYVGELDEVSTSVYISPQVESILGFTPEDRTDTPELWVEHLHPEDRERVVAENNRSNETGEPFDEEYRMITRDGREVWMHDAAVVLRGAEGRPSYRQGVMFDVTERRETEEALHASEARLRTVIEQSPLGIHIFAPDGTSLMVNGAWDELWCLGDEELGHANVFEDEQLRDAGLVEHIERSLAEGAAIVAPPLLFDPANVGREGRACWLRSLIYPVRAEDGRLLETVLLLEDVTERTRAQEALGESEERYRAVVEQSAEAIWLFDPNTKRVLEANAAFQEMLGYGVEELRSMTNYDFVAHSREDVDRTVMRKLRGKENPRAERKYRMKDGTLLDVEVDGTVISYRGKKVICSVARDITERKRVEGEMLEANRRLGELATLRADFTAMVAHEIGAPLATIRGFTEVLETGELGPAEQADALVKIEAEIEGLATLVADVRSAASIERNDFSLAPRPVPVCDLIEDAARFAKTLRGDHQLIVEDAAGSKKVCVDPYRIGQVLRNLLSNAAKHSPEGVPIKLRTSREANSGSVRVEVADSGRGVHPDDAGRIFDKFGRGREEDGRRSYGVGLGLYLSRRIVRAHGGELTYSPAPGRGSVFSFDLESDR